MSDPTTTYQDLVKTLKEIALLGSVSSLLHWDEQTLMPPKGAEARADQSALLARLAHEQFTAPRIGDMLGELEQSNLVADPQSDTAVNIRETRRSFDRERKLPASLVEEMSKTAVLSQHNWAEARKKSDYRMFEPWLGKILALKRQEAACYLEGSTKGSGFRVQGSGPGNGSAGPGQQGNAANAMYDALLESYEPGETTANLRRVFGELRQPLVDLIRRVAESGRKAPLGILERHYPAAAQEKLARDAARLVGFDFDAGRLDISVHPFCSGIGPGDTRMTTRYDEHYFGDAFFGVLHETGHGLYDQGLEKEHFGTPRAEAISLGIHESQSRMWENLVGRGRPFWRFFLPKVRQAFPEALTGVSEDQWIFAVGDVRPSLIRTEADEATYNLHILMRFELEQAMLSGDLGTADVPAIWNQKMQHYLGLTPPDDAKGCLQDIHWSMGAIGYFPTYTLGNLYAAQFFQQARHDIPGLDDSISHGQFAPLLTWLREKIHRHGKRYRAPDLVKRVTGRELSAEPLLTHLRTKAQDLYGV